MNTDEPPASPGIMIASDLQRELEALHAASFGWAMCCCRQQREDAEEVLQTAYIKVLEGKARFDARSSLRTWLFGVIRRTALEQRRRRWLQVVLLEGWHRRMPAPMQAPDPEHAARSSQEVRALRTALTALPQRQQEVLHIVFYQDVTVEESARVLGISVGTARTHFERGKRKLRQILGGETSK